MRLGNENEAFSDLDVLECPKQRQKHLLDSRRDVLEELAIATVREILGRDRFDTDLSEGTEPPQLKLPPDEGGFGHELFRKEHGLSWSTVVAGQRPGQRAASCTWVLEVDLAGEEFRA